MSTKYTYTIRQHGHVDLCGLSNKRTAYKVARSLVPWRLPTARFPMRVYAVAPGQERGQLLYRCWRSVSKNRVIGEDR